MATEYQLSYTAAEIDERLGRDIPSPTIKNKFIPLDWSTGLITANDFGMGEVTFYIGENDENGSPLFDFDKTIVVDIAIRYDGVDYPSSKCHTIPDYTSRAVSIVYNRPVLDDMYSMYVVGRFYAPFGDATATNELFNEINSGDKVPGFTLYYYNIES